MRIRRVDPLSLVKILVFIYAAIGFVVGAFLALLAVAGTPLGPTTAESPAGNLLFGLGAIVLLPIVYGVMGAIGGLIAAVAYNIAAGLMGGLSLEVEP
jgi:hypothetical protein